VAEVLPLQEAQQLRPGEDRVAPKNFGMSRRRQRLITGSSIRRHYLAPPQLPRRSILAALAENRSLGSVGPWLAISIGAPKAN
jgi:hypothetical protein